MGSIWVTGFTALFCIPTGVLASIYLEEYANKDRWWNRLIELNLQNLAAVPAIVFGILGLGIIARAPWLRVHRPHRVAHALPAGPPDGHRRKS